MQELAEKFGAAIVSIEHRYYGKSTPYKELTTENLKYLSSKQAIFDLAVFRQYYQVKISHSFMIIVIPQYFFVSFVWLIYYAFESLGYYVVYVLNHKFHGLNLIDEVFLSVTMRCKTIYRRHKLYFKPRHIIEDVSLIES